MHRAEVIAVTKPKDETISVDEFIAYVARVSNPSNQNNHETAPRLLKYLIANNHWSPLEMAHVVMEINTTRDIARQILRHRSFSFQEFSQRYADPTRDLGFTTREARLQDPKNRQNSIKASANMLVVDPTTMETARLDHVWTHEQQGVISKAKSVYDWAIKNGIAKEQARAVLPEGLVRSRMYMAGSVRSWIHYCQIRMDAGTQREHREVAIDCWYNLIKEFPSLKDLDLISP